MAPEALNGAVLKGVMAVACAAAAAAYRHDLSLPRNKRTI